MARNKLYLIVLILPLLACGLQSNLPVVEIYHTQTPAQVSAKSTPETAQIVGSWNIREQPGEGSKRVATWTDVEVTLYDCKDTDDGGTWCEVEREGVRGWVNRRGLDKQKSVQ